MPKSEMRESLFLKFLGDAEGLTPEQFRPSARLCALLACEAVDAFDAAVLDWGYSDKVTTREDLLAKSYEALL